MNVTNAAYDEAERLWPQVDQRMHALTSERAQKRVSFVTGAEWYATLLNDPLHEYWGTAPVEEVRRALAFQGTMTRALLEEQWEWAESRKVSDEMVERARKALEIRHWDGTGCGTHGSTACSNCFGPSPMSVEEVVRTVLSTALGGQS